VAGIRKRKEEELAAKKAQGAEAQGESQEETARRCGSLFCSEGEAHLGLIVPSGLRLDTAQRRFCELFLTAHTHAHAHREAREAAAREDAERERELVTDPNGIAKLGAKFWATKPQVDVFGQPKSDVGNKLYVSGEDPVSGGVEEAKGRGDGEGQEGKEAEGQKGGEEEGPLPLEDLSLGDKQAPGPISVDGVMLELD
jgi:hypothetical protein